MGDGPGCEEMQTYIIEFTSSIKRGGNSEKRSTKKISLSNNITIKSPQLYILWSWHFI